MKDRKLKPGAHPLEFGSKAAKKLAKEQEALQLKERMEAITDGVVKLSVAAEAMNKSGLTQRAILLLLRDMTGVGMDTIKLVLEALPELKNKYTKVR